MSWARHVVSGCQNATVPLCQFNFQLLVHGIAWLFPGFQYTWLAEETKKNLPIELDFVNEGQNCERIARQLHHFHFLKVC